MFGKLGSALAALVHRDPESRLAAIDRSLSAGWSQASFEALKALALTGHHGAQYRLGRIYETADGVVQSLPDAVHWYRQAAEGGDVAAQVRLGLIYFIEPPGPASLTGVEEAARDGGDKGGSEGEGNAAGIAPLPGALAQFFPHGVTVRQDFAEALKWNRLAAEAGSADAQARLGHQYALGLGVAADPAAAERWFAAAAEQSSAEGELGLGLLYAGSYDTPPDLPRAAQWLERAAAQDHKIAQYGLGKLKVHGEGTPKDPAAAIRLLERPSMPIAARPGCAAPAFAATARRAAPWRSSCSRGPKMTAWRRPRCCASRQRRETRGPPRRSRTAMRSAAACRAMPRRPRAGVRSRKSPNGPRR
jgi:TPR repeat protein